MEHNELHSSDKRSTSPQHSEGRPESSDQNQRYSGRANPNGSWQAERQRKKTTKIALSVLLIVSLGLIGFEIITGAPPKEEPEQPRGSKALMILSKERELESAGLIASLSPTWKDNEYGDKTALKETNRVQANKIKALRRQLTEANQKLHEVKANLFNKGDPAERAKLAEICQELVEKERKSDELSTKLSDLEHQSARHLEKIRRMEHTIDALATMTDTQRETKEKAILSFQAQVEEIQNTAREERQELLKTLAQMEDKHVELKEALAAKMTAIRQLEDEVSSLYAQLDDKNEALKNDALLYTTSEKNLNKQLQNLVAQIELQYVQNQNLQSELDVTLAKSNAQEEYSKSLEDRIQAAENEKKVNFETFANAKIKLAREYLDLQGLLDVITDSNYHFDSKQKKLATLVKEEQARAHKLEKELDNALAQVDAEQQRSLCIEEELHHTAQKVDTLQEELASSQALFEKQQQEFEMLTYSNASLKDQLHEKIHQLTASLKEEQDKLTQEDEVVRNLAINLELEKTKTQELNHRLKDALETSEEQANYILGLETEVNTKAETVAALEDRLQDRQKEINEQKSLLATMKTSFEEEKKRSQELHKALVAALEESESDQYLVQQFKDQFDENSQALTQLQDRMSEKRRTIDDMTQYIEDLSQEMAEAKTKNQELQGELELAHKENFSEKNRVMALEAEITNNTDTIVNLQDALADKQQEIRHLIEQVQTLAKDLNFEKTQAKDLQKSLTETAEKQENEYYKAKTLEQSVEDNEKQITGLLDQLDEVASNYEKERSRSEELEKNLFSVMSKLDDKEKTLDNILADNKVTQDEFSTLKKEIARLRQERDDLVRKNKKQADLLLQQQELMRKPARGSLMHSPAAETGDTKHMKEVAMETFEEHTVGNGESLSSISVYYYGTPNRLTDIFNANRNVLKNKNSPLQPGTKLRIPN